VPPLKLPTFAPMPQKPAKQPNQSLDGRVRVLEDHADRMHVWGTSLIRALMGWSKQLDDLFNRGSVKRL